RRVGHVRAMASPVLVLRDHELRLELLDMAQAHQGAPLLRALGHGLRQAVHVAGGAVVDDGDPCVLHRPPLSAECCLRRLGEAAASTAPSASSTWTSSSPVSPASSSAVGARPPRASRVRCARASLTRRSWTCVGTRIVADWLETAR